jgi:uncharacterized protein (DUF2062 family)
MFLPFVAATVISAMFIQLGAMSVWIVVLKAMLVVAISAALLFGGLCAWSNRRK